MHHREEPWGLQPQRSQEHLPQRHLGFKLTSYGTNPLPKSRLGRQEGTLGLCTFTRSSTMNDPAQPSLPAEKAVLLVVRPLPAQEQTALAYHR